MIFTEGRDVGVVKWGACTLGDALKDHEFDDVKPGMDGFGHGVFDL